MLEKICDKYKRERVCIGLVSILIIINILTIFLIRGNIGSFTYKEEKFRLISSNLHNTEFKDQKGNKLKLSEGKNENIEFDYSGEYKYTMTYKGKTTIHENELDKTVTTLSDGSKYNQSTIGVESEGEYNPDEVELINEAIHSHKKLNYFNKDIFYGLLISIAFALLGPFNLIYPEKVWAFKHWLHIGGEPTEFAIKSNKFGGIIFCIMSEVILIIIAIS